jgi:hypothetical protein
MTAAATKLKNDPLPAMEMTTGTMINTDDAGVTAESTIISVPSAPRTRFKPAGLFDCAMFHPFIFMLLNLNPLAHCCKNANNGQ